MKSSCSSVSELLERYFDREVTGQEKTLVDAHLGDCSSCRDTLKSMENLAELVKVPSERMAEKVDFDRIWVHLHREARNREAVTSWFDVSRLFRRRVWIPALVTALVAIVVMVPLLFKKSPSLPVQFGVEYVESRTNNVMVYEIEKAKVTVIWLLEGPEAESTTTL